METNKLTSPLVVFNYTNPEQKKQAIQDARAYAQPHDLFFFAQTKSSEHDATEDLQSQIIPEGPYLRALEQELTFYYAQYHDSLLSSASKANTYNMQACIQATTKDLADSYLRAFQEHAQGKRLIAVLPQPVVPYIFAHSENVDQPVKPRDKKIL